MEKEHPCLTEAKQILKGRKIIDVFYMDDEEMKEAMWYKRPIQLRLDNDTIITVSMDDEGNDGGALHYCTNAYIYEGKPQKEPKMGVIPVLS